MNKAVVVESDITIKDAAKIMSEKNIGCLIALVDNKIVGIISETDITRNVDKLEKKISTVMSKKVVSIEQDRTVDAAAALMAKNRIKRLPVLSKGKLVGIVTATDIIANSEDLNEDFFFD